MSELTQATKLINNQFGEQFPEFKTLRVYGTIEEPLFLAVDVQQLLGISQINYNKDYEEGEDYYKIKVEYNSHPREMVAFTEHGLYGIIYRSRTDLSSKFRKFVTIILKELRMKGRVELSTAIEKLNDQLQKERREKLMIDNQLVEEHKKLESQQKLSEKYYMQLYEAQSSILTLKNKVNHHDLWAKGSAEYRLGRMKEKYFRKVYLYIESVPKNLKDTIEEYNRDDEPNDSDERIWSVTMVKRDRDEAALAYVPPGTTNQALQDHIKDFAMSELKSRYLCSMQDLQQRIDELE